MPSSNTPELDPGALAEKLKNISTHRRRVDPLFTKPQATVTFATEDMKMAEEPRSSDKSRVQNLQTPGQHISLTDPAVAPISRPISSAGTPWKVRIRSIPVLGAVIAWVYALVRMNVNRQHVAQDLIELRQIQQETGSSLNRLEAVSNRLEALNISGRLNRLDALDISNRLNAFDTINIANRLDKIEATMCSILERNVERDNRIAGLIQELRRGSQVVYPTEAASASGATPTGNEAASNSFDMDNFYVEFEGVFRGSREDIQERLNVYLPYLARFAGDDTAQVIDIGCGRGEWLQLLTQQRINAAGIDMNNTMVNLCHERGLKATCADAIVYLKQQSEGSVAAITGFHIIEHLPFDTLIALFDAALQALRPDGIIIFETPNPENVIVGSCNFYYDPTHRHPIAPVVAEFIARQRGYARAEILRVNAVPDRARIVEDSEVARRFNNAFYGPQDYAVLAWKTYEN